MDDIRVANKKETRKIVVAIELERDERLPDNFSFLINDFEAGKGERQHMLVTDYRGQSFHRDLRTLETKRNENTHKLVSSNDHETVIKCTEGIRVTLPPNQA